MSKKGFTLIELLSVIVLLSLLMGIAIPGISKISKNAKKKTYKTKTNLIEQAAIYWGQDNKTLLKRDKCEINSAFYECYKIKVNDLIEDDYLDGENNTNIMKNPLNDSENLNDKCVYIYKKNNRVYSLYKNDDKCEHDIIVQKCSIKNANDLSITIESSDGIETNNWHTSETEFKLKNTSNYTGNCEESKFQIEYLLNSDWQDYSEPIKYSEETPSKDLKTKICYDNICSEFSSYVIKYDVTAPTISNTNITYNTDNSIPTLKAIIKDNYSSIKYYIDTEESNSNDNSKYTISSASLNKTMNSASNTSYYLHAMDEAGNKTTKEFKVYNCIPTSYSKTSSCSGRGYSGTQKCSGHITVSDNLKYLFQSRGCVTTYCKRRDSEGNLNKNSNEYIESKVRDIACANSRGCGIEILTPEGTVCYNNNYID